MCINILCIPHKQRGRYLRLLAINSLQVGFVAAGRIYESRTPRENSGPETKGFVCIICMYRRGKVLNVCFHRSDTDSDALLFASSI